MGWDTWGDRAWKVDEILAAREAPKHTGGWEYRVRWKGGYEETWEPEIQLMKGQGMCESLEAAKQHKHIHTRFERWLTAHAQRGSPRATRALARAQEESIESREEGWKEVWEKFMEYAAAASQHEDRGYNVGSAPRQKRGQQWDRTTAQMGRKSVVPPPMCANKRKIPANDIQCRSSFLAVSGPLVAKPGRYVPIGFSQRTMWRVVGSILCGTSVLKHFMRRLMHCRATRRSSCSQGTTSFGLRPRSRR